MILFNKHKGIHMDKRFISTLITKLKNLSIKGIKTFSVQNKVVQSARELSQRVLRGRGSRVRFPKEERCAESPPTFICGKHRVNRRKLVKMKNSKFGSCIYV